MNVRRVKRTGWIVAAGVLAGLIVPLVLGETFARLRPPANTHEFLGDASPWRGDFTADPKQIVRYNADSIYSTHDLVPLSTIPKTADRPTWLYSGVSFGWGIWNQTDQMKLPRRVLYMHQINDRLHMRIAHARRILEYGIKLDRIVFVLIPLEIARYTETPLASIYVNNKGAITQRVRPAPPPFDWVLDHSRLALLGYIRARLHTWLPYFRLSTITENFPPIVENDFRFMLGQMAELQKQFGVKITVAVLPDRRQVLNDNSNYAMQNAFRAIGKETGIDIYDPVQLLRSRPDRRAQFLPDWHYTPEGYAFVARDLAAHLLKLDKDQPAKSSELAR
ncbi:MAG: hypothetical protein K2P86_13765 [Xanthobacteraceae bacterium]|nr:hypothetical protein [Xanthobacteraceae bacterium]